MRAVGAREANQAFAELLRRVEKGEEVMITKHGTPVALLSPYRPPAMTPERKAAVERAIRVMREPVRPRAKVRRFRRDEMHER